MQLNHTPGSFKRRARSLKRPNYDDERHQKHQRFSLEASDIHYDSNYIDEDVAQTHLSKSKQTSKKPKQPTQPKQKNRLPPPLSKSVLKQPKRWKVPLELQSAPRADMRAMSEGAIRRFFLGHPKMKNDPQYRCHWKSKPYNWGHHEETPSSFIPERANHQQGDNDDVAATSEDEEEESLGALLDQQNRLNRRIEVKIQVEARIEEPTSAEYRWTQSATAPQKNGFRNTQARTAGPVSQHQASPNDEPNRAPSYQVLERPGNPVARQLSSGGIRPDSGVKRVVSSQVPPLHHPKSFARRAVMERGVSSMGAPPNMPLPPVPGPPTFDHERWTFTSAQLPTTSGLVVNHAQVPRGMNQLGFQAAGFAHHQKNRQHEVPVEVVRGVIPSPFEIASQGASKPTQTNFSPPDRDRRNQGDVRSDSSRHRSSNMPTPGRSGRGRPRALYIRSRASSANHGYPAMPPRSDPLPRSPPNAPQRQLGYYNAPKNDDYDQEEHQMPLSFSGRIMTRQRQAQQDYNHEMHRFFQAHQNARPRHAEPPRQQPPTHRDDYYPQAFSNQFSAAPSSYSQPPRGQAQRSPYDPYDPYGAQQEQVDMWEVEKFSQDGKRAKGNNGQQRRDGGHNGYNYRSGPGPGPCGGGSSGDRGARTNPYVGGSYNAGEGSGGNSNYRGDGGYGGGYENRGNGGVSGRRKKRTSLQDDSFLNFDSSDFSNAEEYGGWKRGETFGGCDRGKGKESELLRQQVHHSLVNMMAEDPGLMRHLMPNAVGPSQPQVVQPVSALKPAPQQPMQNAAVALEEVLAADRPRPDSMTLPPTGGQSTKSQLSQLQGWKPAVPTPPARQLNFSHRLKTQKAQSSVAGPSKEAPATDKPAEAQKPSAPNVPTQPQTAAVETPINVAQSVFPLQAQPQPAVVKEKPFSLAEITKQKQERAAERRANRTAQKAKDGFMTTAAKATALIEGLLQDPSYLLKESSLFVQEDEISSALLHARSSNPSHIPAAVFPDKGKGEEKAAGETSPMQTSEARATTDGEAASEVDGLFEDPSEAVLRATTGPDPKAISAASANVAETSEVDAHAQTVADLKAKTDEKQRLREINSNAAAEKAAKERASTASKTTTTPYTPKTTVIGPRKPKPAPALLRRKGRAVKSAESVVDPSVGDSDIAMVDVGAEELMNLRSEPKSPVKTGPKKKSMSPSPPPPTRAAPNSSADSTPKAPPHSQQLETPVPEVNPAPAESAEIFAIKAQLAKFQAEAAAREEAAKKEAVGKAAQQARIEELTKALAEKQRSRAPSVTGIPPAPTPAKKKSVRPPASTYKEQAHVSTEQEKRARDIKNNSDYLKSDKAWTQRYMKKHGKVGAVPPDDAALNAEREKEGAGEA